MRNNLAFRPKVDQNLESEEAVDSTESHIVIDESKSIVS